MMWVLGLLGLHTQITSELRFFLSSTPFIAVLDARHGRWVQIVQVYHGHGVGMVTIFLFSIYVVRRWRSHRNERRIVVLKGRFDNIPTSHTNKQWLLGRRLLGVLRKGGGQREGVYGVHHFSNFWSEWLGEDGAVGLVGVSGTSSSRPRPPENSCFLTKTECFQPWLAQARAAQ